MNIMSKFNLPTYVKGKSFSEASAMIAKRFEGRNSPEDVETLNELQGRLQQAQEFVKSEQESKSEPQHQMPDGSMMDGAAHGQEGAPDEAQAPAGLNEGAVPSGAEQLSNQYEGGGSLDPIDKANKLGQYSSGLPSKYENDDFSDIPNESLLSNLNANGMDHRKPEWMQKRNADYRQVWRDQAMKRKDIDYDKATDKWSQISPEKIKEYEGKYGEDYNTKFQGANKFEGGGFAKSVGGKGFQEGASSEDLMGSVGAGLGGLTALAGMGKQAFGSTGIDTSGVTAAPDVPSQGSAAAGGALKGASAGAAFGPWGAAIGGVLGGAAGLIGGGKAKRDAQEAAVNNDMKLHNDATNDYKSGGSLVANMYEHGGEHDFMSENDKYMAESRVGQPLAGSTLVANNSIDFMAENDKFMNESRIGQPLASIQPRSRVASLFNEGELNGMSKGVQDLVKPRARVTSLFDDGELDKMTTGVQDVSSMTTELQKRRDPNHDKSPWDENSGSKFNAAEALRYAPSLSNAMQLSNLKKPEQQGMDRLGNKYNEQLVDERGLQNTVQENVLNNRNALLSSSGGSGSSARANLLASQLQGGKVQSQAYQQAGEANRKENRAGQAFNKDTDKTNLSQSNLENRTNLELQAGYDSNKSKLIAQLGQDLGGIGKEEMFKKFPELMGLSYGAQGEHFRTLKAAQDKKKAERMLKKSKKK